MNEIERHIQQTTDRLQCIKQHLLGSSSFRTAARELLEWCLDERAFQPHFEAGLISCLTVVSRVAPQAGYDFDLGYRLLAVCAAHKDKFSPSSAGLLSSWSEELGQLLLQRQQARQTLTETKSENPTLENPTSEKSMQMGTEVTQLQSLESQGELNAWAATSQMSSPLDSVSWDTVADGNMMPFDQGPPCFPARSPSFAGKQLQQHQQQQQQQQPQQPLPQQPQTQQPQPPTHQVAQHGFPKSPYNPSLATGFAGQTPPNGFNQLNGYPPTPTTPGSSKSVYESSPLTESLTAVMSPASATTTMMSPKMWPRQENVRMNGTMFNSSRPQMYPGVEMFDDPFYNHHYAAYDASYPQQPAMRRMPGQPPGYGYSHGMMALHSNVARSPKEYGPMPLRAGGIYTGRQQVAPYPCNPQQYMRSKRAQCPMGQQMMYGPFREQMGQPCYGPRLGPVQGQPHMAPGVNYLPSQAVRPGDPYGCNPVSYAAYPSSNGSLYPGPADMKNNPQPYYMCSPHSQMPGNPTPPVTPGSTIPTYMSPGADVKPNMADLKPMSSSSLVNAGELRLTFPLHDGILMAPFRLEHNLAVSNHVFHLNESVYQALMSRSDLELHLKCFHHEDCQMTTNWPASVMVSVNATPMNIEIQRPLNVKDVCHLGRNTIQITVTACCCSHMFIVHLVHRPTVRSVICGLLEKNLLSAEQCLVKLKPFLSQATSAPPSVTASTMTQANGTKLSLKCPLTLQRVCLPTRGQHCSHLQWFDLQTYLQLNSERCVWKCPICKKPATLEELEVNQLIWAIAENLRSTDFDEILLDSSGTWRPLPTVMQITSDNNNETAASKFIRGTTLSSMTLPTVETWTESYSSRAASSSAAVSSAARSVPHAGNSKETWNNSSVPGGTSDILTSLAQMGESLVDSRVQSSLPSRLATSVDSMSTVRPTTSTSTIPEKVPSTSTNCGTNSVFTSAASSEAHDCHRQQLKAKEAATSAPADASVGGNVSDDGRNTDSHLKETSCSSSSCSSSGSSGSSSSNVDFNFKLTPNCNSEQQDSGLDLLTDGFEDPTELLTYLGPTGGNSGDFGMGDDLLSLFLPD